MTQKLIDHLLELHDKMETLARELLQKHNNAYYEGMAKGLSLAASELKIVLDEHLQPPEDMAIADKKDTGTIQIIGEPLVGQEYLYVVFARDSQGIWRLKSLDGVLQTDRENRLSFDDTIRALAKKGWKLDSFAKGIHIFKRDK